MSSGEGAALAVSSYPCIIYLAWYNINRGL
jgi:hypothetical protein